MFQAKGFAELARAIREQSSKSIWCFTGYLFENLVKNPEKVTLAKGSLMISFISSSVEVIVPWLMSHDCGLWQPGQWLGHPAQ